VSRGDEQSSRGSSLQRQQRYRRGLSAEVIAAGYLMLRGHLILARRYKTPLGEIDLICLKRGRVAFIEVKSRNTRDACEASITPRLRQRVRRAADLWLARHPRYQQHQLGFDVVFVTPWRVPVYIANAL
jgi:putative endonuclease